MAQRKLSILQQAYKEFFLAMLVEYGVDSPARLGHERKKDFFSRIKEGWKVKKKELLKENVKLPPPSKKAQYAKVKVSRPSIPIEPQGKNVKRLPADQSEDASVKIKSEENPEQEDDLRINFHPNHLFDQVEN